MKKYLAIALAFILTISILSLCSSAEETTIYIEELGLSVTVPDGYEIINEDTPANHYIFKEYGLTKDEYLSYQKEQYFAYVDTVGKKGETLRLCAWEDDSKPYELYTEDEIQKLAKETSAVYSNVIDYGVKFHGQTYFIYTFMQLADYPDYQQYLASYVTIHNGVRYMLDLAVSGDGVSITGKHKYELDKTIDSFIFEDQAPIAGSQAPYYESEKTSGTFDIEISDDLKSIYSQELGVTFSVPEGYEPVHSGTEDSHWIFDYVGWEKEEYLEQLKESNIYIKVVHKDGSAMDFSALASDKIPYNAYTEDELNDLLKKQMAQYPSDNYRIIESGILEHPQTTFTYFSATSAKNKDMDWYFIQYTTRYNGIYFGLTLNYFGEEAGLYEKHAAAMEETVNALIFDSDVPLVEAQPEEETVQSAVYDITAGNVRVTMPDGYHVVHDSVPEDAKIFAELGKTKEQQLTEQKENRIKLAAYKQGKLYPRINIYVSTANDGIVYLDNGVSLSKELADLFTERGIAVSDVTAYGTETQDSAFMLLSDPSTNTYCATIMNVINGIKIQYLMQSYMELTQEDIDTLRSIADTAEEIVPYTDKFKIEEGNITVTLPYGYEAIHSSVPQEASVYSVHGFNREATLLNMENLSTYFMAGRVNDFDPIITVKANTFFTADFSYEIAEKKAEQHRADLTSAGYSVSECSVWETNDVAWVYSLFHDKNTNAHHAQCFTVIGEKKIEVLMTSSSELTNLDVATFSDFVKNVEFQPQQIMIFGLNEESIKTIVTILLIAVSVIFLAVIVIIVILLRKSAAKRKKEQDPIAVCPVCQNKISPNGIYCSKCGLKVK